MTDTDDTGWAWLATVNPDTVESERYRAHPKQLIATERTQLGNVYETLTPWERMRLRHTAEADRLIRDRETQAAHAEWNRKALDRAAEIRRKRERAEWRERMQAKGYLIAGSPSSLPSEGAAA